MPAELSALLLMGIARGQGSAQMLLELLAVLHEKGLLSEPDVQRVVNVMADNMRDFDAQVQGTVVRTDALKG